MIRVWSSSSVPRLIESLDDDRRQMDNQFRAEVQMVPPPRLELLLLHDHNYRFMGGEPHTAC